MEQNESFIAKICADTAENKQNFANNLSTTRQNDVRGPADVVGGCRAPAARNGALIRTGARVVRFEPENSFPRRVYDLWAVDTEGRRKILFQNDNNCTINSYLRSKINSKDNT